jgi:Fe-S-cluster containining protein
MTGEKAEEFIKPNGVPMVCLRCGTCCRKHQVRLDLVEARRIADELTLSWEEFSDRYLDERWPGAESFLLRHGDSGCIFLVMKKDAMPAECRIHSFRPSSCRDWIPGRHRPECRVGLGLD